MKNKSGLKLKKQITPYLYLSPTVILMLVLLVVPICLIVKYSFQNNAIVVADPVFVGLDNYIKILADSEFVGAVKTTFIFVVVSVAAHIVLGMCLRASPEHEVFSNQRTKTSCQSHLRPSLGIHGLGYSDFVEIDAAARRDRGLPCFPS